MKAESQIYTTLQKPMTMLGLPPVLTMTACAGAGTVFCCLVLVGSLILAIPAGLVSGVLLWLFFYRRCRDDHHFLTVLTGTHRFWRTRPVRYLIAGHAPTRPTRSSGEPS